jgi:hypothetical protein
MNPITVNYSEATQAFMSFLSSKPKWYLDFKYRYYSLDNINTLRLHNSNSRYNVLSTTPTTIGNVTTPETADKSKIKLIVNGQYEQTKVFDNVNYTGDFILPDNLSNINFSTKTQQSNIVDYIERREDTYKFAIPRAGTENFADRMRGKYLVSNYEFSDPTNANKFNLPFIKTTYRYSMI